MGFYGDIEKDIADLTAEAPTFDCARHFGVPSDRSFADYQVAVAKYDLLTLLKQFIEGAGVERGVASFILHLDNKYVSRTMDGEGAVAVAIQSIRYDLVRGFRSGETYYRAEDVYMWCAAETEHRRAEYQAEQEEYAAKRAAETAAFEEEFGTMTRADGTKVTARAVKSVLKGIDHSAETIETRVTSSDDTKWYDLKAIIVYLFTSADSEAARAALIDGGFKILETVSSPTRLVVRLTSGK